MGRPTSYASLSSSQFPTSSHLLSRCSVNFSFNETGKILYPGKTMNRCPSYNAINVMKEIVLSLLSHVLRTPHFTVACFDFPFAPGTAIRRSGMAFKCWVQGHQVSIVYSGPLPFSGVSLLTLIILHSIGSPPISLTFPFLVPSWVLLYNFSPWL